MLKARRSSWGCRCEAEREEEEEAEEAEASLMGRREAVRREAIVCGERAYGGEGDGDGDDR